MRPRWFFLLKQRLRRENWRSLGLLLAIFTILLLGVSSAVRGLDFGLLWPPTLLGLALGWILAASAAPGGLVVLLGLLIGPILILIQIGNLITSLANLVISLVEAVRQLIFPEAAPVTSSLPSAWDELSAGATVLVLRLYDWLLALVRGQPVFDPVATTILWLLVLWGAAVWAGWTVRRRNQPILALLPAMILLAIMLTITGESALYLAPALALTLIMNATSAQALREQKWIADEIGFSARPGRNAVWTAFGLALALMIVALITPSPSIYRLVDYVRNLSTQQRDRELARSLGLEAPPDAPAADSFSNERFGGLPARHLIGSGPELSQQPVMEITVEDPASLASQLRYWRGVTYDRYTGRGWETRGTATIAYEAGETAGRIRGNQRAVRQEVRPLADLGSLLYAAGTLTTVDQAFQIAWRARYRGTDTYTDFFAAATAEGETGTYRADSLVPVFNESGLRAAELDIPDWITEHYVALPEDISDRVLALGRELTATEPTPYDRALAIERHLRQFPYTLDLPAPPADREIADYFLFELQRGYCDYYATTMVVLARSAGLPARLATGYIGGAYDEENRRYTVTADLAHSWPEIYFPEYGWIPFEPTGGRATIERPAATEPQIEPASDTELEPITAARTRARWNLLLRIAAGLLLLAFVVTLGWWLLDVWRLRFLSPERSIVRLFEQMSRSGRRLDVRPELGETPHEFAGRLGARLAEISQLKVGTTSLASAPGAIEWLTGLYARSLYSPYQPEALQQKKALRIWSRLRFQLLWAALLSWSKKR